MNEHPPHQAAPARGALKADRDVRAMFGRIVPRYDLMNRLMTFGRDARWRRMAARHAVAAAGDRVLDVATGTGDLAFALAEAGARSVVGLDFAAPMVRAAEVKRANKPPNPPAPVPPPLGGKGEHVAFVVGDALRLPFRDGVFDAVTVAFGLRNMANYESAVRELGRVIRPGGRLVCLEMTPLRRPITGRLFNWYFSRVVPLIGGVVSGDREAYRYLPSSVAAFPDADALAALMQGAGFAAVEVERLGGGTVALHVASRDQ